MDRILYPWTIRVWVWYCSTLPIPCPLPSLLPRAKGAAGRWVRPLIPSPRLNRSRVALTASRLELLFVDSSSSRFTLRISFRFDISELGALLCCLHRSRSYTILPVKKLRIQLSNRGIIFFPCPFQTMSVFPV
jgi:hypothetical protein